MNKPLINLRSFESPEEKEEPIQLEESELPVIRVERIPERGETSSCGRVPLVRFKRLIKDEGSQQGHLNYEISLSRTGDTCLLKGHLHYTLTMACDRCLQSFGWDYDEPFQLTLIPQAMAETYTREIVLSEDDLDTAFYEGEELDLTFCMEEQLLLSLPFKRICQDSCLGLCGQCGCNLNQEPCQCDVNDFIDNPFSGLKLS